MELIKKKRLQPTFKQILSRFKRLRNKFNSLRSNLDSLGKEFSSLSKDLRGHQCKPVKPIKREVIVSNGGPIKAPIIK